LSAFRDFYALFPALVLPIRGIEYEVPTADSVSVNRWKADYAKQTAGETIAPEDVLTDADLEGMFLGDVADRMRADGVRPDVLSHALITAISDAVGGRMLAERVWNTADPEFVKAVQAQQAKAAEGETPQPETKPAPRKRATKASNR
jgi:hypothetical protein